VKRRFRKNAKTFLSEFPTPEIRPLSIDAIRLRRLPRARHLRIVGQIDPIGPELIDRFHKRELRILFLNVPEAAGVSPAKPNSCSQHVASTEGFRCNQSLLTDH